MLTAKSTATIVKRGPLPRWLVGILRKECPYAHLRKDPRSERQALESLFCGIKIDHWGTTEWEGIKNYFVTEPYGVDPSQFELMRKKGQQFGFAVFHSKESYHNPGGECERVLIFPTDLPPNKTYNDVVVQAVKEVGYSVKNGKVQPKIMQICKHDLADKRAFESHMAAMGRIADDFFDRPVSVEMLEPDHFIFHCIAGNDGRLRRVLNSAKKWARETCRTIPLIEIRVIETNELISVGDGQYVSNRGFYIKAFERKEIASRNVARVEQIIREALGDMILRTAIGEPNQYNEQHLFVELHVPVTAKFFNQFESEIKPKLEKLSSAGYSGILSLKRTSSWSSTSKFLKKQLENSK